MDGSHWNGAASEMKTGAVLKLMDDMAFIEFDGSDISNVSIALLSGVYLLWRQPRGAINQADTESLLVTPPEKHRDFAQNLCGHITQKCVLYSWNHTGNLQATENERFRYQTNIMCNIKYFIKMIKYLCGLIRNILTFLLRLHRMSSHKLLSRIQVLSQLTFKGIKILINEFPANPG